MDDEHRKWVELILQGQRDLDDMAKQEEKPSEALIQAAKREIELAAGNIGITLKEFATIWKPDITAKQFEEAVKKLKTGRKLK